MRFEYEYLRTGALTYLAASDGHHARLFDRGELKTSIGAIDRLDERVMTTEPYASARPCLLDRRQLLVAPRR
jgi:hypothetical protein